MGRVIVEAFCRGRPLVASRVGGIPDLVRGRRATGCSSSRETRRRSRPRSFALLTDRALAERLGAGAQASAGQWTISPEEFASRLRALVERIAGLS